MTDSNQKLTGTPFDNAEEAWFWFIRGMQVSDPVRYSMNRPCEPVDVLKIIDRLHKQRRLSMDQILVLRHYGRRMSPPDERRPKEYRAHKLWAEAMERLEAEFQRKGITTWKVKRGDG